MTLTISLAVGLCFFSTATLAWSDVYLCVDANGKKEYKNTGNVKGCTKLDLHAPTQITAPAPSVQRKPVSSPKVVNVPSSFPKIDDSTQKSRDMDRRQIFLDEQKTEELKLASLIKEFNNGAPERRPEDKTQEKYLERTQHLRSEISRSEKNLEALKRELSKIK